MQKKNYQTPIYYEKVASCSSKGLELSSTLRREMILSERRDLMCRFHNRELSPDGRFVASRAYEGFANFLWEQGEYYEAWRSYCEALYLCRYWLSEGGSRSRSAIRNLRIRFRELDSRVVRMLQGNERLLALHLKDATLCAMRLNFGEFR